MVSIKIDNLKLISARYTEAFSGCAFGFPNLGSDFLRRDSVVIRLFLEAPQVLESLKAGVRMQNREIEW